MRRSILLFVLTLAGAPILATAAADPFAWVPDVGGVVMRDARGGVIAVDLRASWVSDSDLVSLANVATLRRLDLSETRISDHGLRELRSAPAISYLNLRYAELITDQGVSALKTWKHLTRLNLEGTKITEGALQQLAELTSLQSLNIGGAQVTDAGVEALTALSNLRELTLGGNKLTDAGLQPLRQMPGLVSLDLGGTQRQDSGTWSVSFTQPGLDAAATLKSLRQLRLNNTLISARGLETLKILPLELLDLHDCPRINGEAIPILVGMRSLRLVDLTGTNMSTADVERLRKMRPDCRIIDAPGTTGSKAQSAER